MKESLRGYFEYTEDEFNEIWNDCTFVFDANVLLDLLRVTDETRRAIFDMLYSIIDRIWIPYNVAYEFARNKREVSKEYEKQFNEIIETLSIKDNCTEKINNFINRISASDDYKKFLNDLVVINNNNVKEKIGEIKNESFNDYNANKIEEEILKIFNGKIGEKLTVDRLKEIYKQGDERYKSKVPPGYKDKGKETIHDKYGDLINWLSIIEYSKNNSKNVIFITNDSKEDWFIIESGKIIFPQPELITEFHNETKKQIYIYRTQKFLEYARDKLDLNGIEDRVLNEIVLMEEELAKERVKNAALVMLDLNTKFMIKYWEDKLSILQDEIKEFENKYDIADEWTVEDNFSYSKLLSQQEVVLSKINEIRNFNSTFNNE